MEGVALPSVISTKRTAVVIRARRARAATNARLASAPATISEVPESHTETLEVWRSRSLRDLPPLTASEFVLDRLPSVYVTKTHEFLKYRAQMIAESVSATSY
jgi:hypothetical protein